MNTGDNSFPPVVSCPFQPKAGQLEVNVQFHLREDCQDQEARYHSHRSGETTSREVTRLLAIQQRQQNGRTKETRSCEVCTKRGQCQQQQPRLNFAVPYCICNFCMIAWTSVEPPLSP
ncbi:hypothetical protein B566_EDAN010914 [Ephemera danica]|nr:hypothetical protein B566_EDAN010914 [Ephemera danica]